AGVPNTVYLRSGATITADLLDQSAERVVLDLGYTVMAIPMAEVDRLDPVTADEAPGSDHVASSTDLYRAASGGRARSVQENAAQLGAAVVQIRTPTGLGSGFVINREGYIVTNEHVVAGEYEVTVTVF